MCIRDRCSGAYCADNCWRVDGDLCEWAGSHQVDGIDGIATALFGVLFALLLCGCCFAFLQLAQKLVSNLLQGWDLDQDGKVEIHEMMCVSFDSSFCGAQFCCATPDAASPSLDPAGTCWTSSAATSASSAAARISTSKR